MANEGGRLVPERPRIERLPSELIDQIAAGEVVERPASVVKELVENAVDARASRLRIELREGGRALVAVTDDGIGLTPAEARLALERHATSKLRTLSDLGGIRSFGFRGEALARNRVGGAPAPTHRAQGAPEGTEIEVHAGAWVGERACATSEGTRVEVADLFGSVPARRKFLKSPATEWGHASEWVARAALALPHVHFDVIREEHPAWSWPAVTNPVERIAAVLGEEEAAALVAAERSAGDLALRAFVSRPELHRATGAGIHLFVNGRPVRDRLLRHALLQVYRDVLPRGRFPCALLFLEVAPGGVDVNVHPAKWEVRFADPQAVHRLIERTLADALGSRAWLGFEARASVAERSLGGSDWSFATREAVTPARPGALPFEESSAAATVAPRLSELRMIGQLLATYVLLEGPEGLLLVDQHAAHERVLYERLRASWLSGKLPRQQLLAPAMLELPAPAVSACTRNDFALAQLGFEVEAFGEQSLAVRTVPELLAGRDPAPLLRELAEQLGSDESERAGAERRPLDATDRLFATLACHAARRAGEALPLEELRFLMREVDSIPWAPTCPHGRPVVLPLSKGEIERRFGRA